MNRRLAVPLAVRGLVCKDRQMVVRSRKLSCDEDAEDIAVLRKLVDTKQRIEALLQDLDDDSEIEDTPEMSNELDYIKASIQLGLLEITGELEEIPYSDDMFEEAVA